MRVKEVDGSPSVIPVNTIRVTDGTLTDNGGATVTIATGGGGGGSMTSFDVAGNAGPSQTVSDGETLTIQGGSSGADIKVTMSSSDTATIDLQDSGVSASTYSNPTFTVDAKGRITSASSGSTPGDVSGSGTSTYVTYWNGAKTVTGSSNLTFDGTNLSVGGYVKSGTGVYDTNGTTDLTLQTNAGTNSGTLSLKNGTDGNLIFDPSGTGLLQIEGTTNPGSIKLMCEAGTHGVTIQSPAHSANATYTFKMPTTMGTDGQVLTTDGTSQTSWTSVSGASGTVTSVGTSAPLTGGTITTTGSLGITQADSTTDGYLSSTDWNTFNGKQNALTLTTTGTSGASTLVGATLNIPQYSASVTFPLEAPDGSAAAPSYSFSSDTNTGIFREDNDAISFTVGGTRKIKFTTSGLQMTSGQIQADGSTLTNGGGYSFSGDTDTGIEKYFANYLTLRTAGSPRFTIGSSGEILIGGTTSGNDGDAGTSGQVLTSAGASSPPTWTTPSGGGSNTDSAGFKMESGGANPRVPMANAMAGTVTNAGMNSYYAKGTLFTVLEDKTLDKCWIYINTLESSAPSGVKIGIYELPTNTLDQTSVTGTLIATADFATSKFDSSTGSTGYSSESWSGASGQSLTLDKTKYYACMVSSWANDQQSDTTYRVLAFSASNLPNTAGSQGSVGTSSGFQAWINGTTDPSATLSLSAAGGVPMPAIWSRFS